jgi:hypothetical protein
MAQTSGVTPHGRRSMMRKTVIQAFRSTSGIAMAAALFAACADQPQPLAPDTQYPFPAQVAAAPGVAQESAIFATIRRVTARYHDLDAAIADGFVFLHECENRPGEGPVGMVYIHLDRLLDGVIDPALPDGLVYEPSRNGEAKLVAAEFAMPYALWTSPTPPTFLGAEFQREDEFGVYGLHVWVWRHNPHGMFGESNPNVTCDAS